MTRTHLLNLQRQMYRRFRARVDDYMGQLGPELKRYYNEYESEFQRFGKITDKSELFEALLASRIVLCGDYHTLRQAQRTVVRLLRELIPRLRKRNQELVLFLEMVPARCDGALIQFQKGEISEEQFLKSIGFAKRWGFSWDNYRKLLDFCKSLSIEVRGLNGPRSQATLRERDEFGGERIARWVKDRPNAVAFVLVGDMHLAPNHLPREITHSLGETKVPLLRVHQNYDGFYWKLVERGREDAEVIRLKQNAYCVMNTPPWIKLQSLLKWSEVITYGTSDLSQFLYARKHGRDDFYVDPFADLDFSDEFFEVVRAIHRFLGLPGEPPSNFHILSPYHFRTLGNLSAIEKVQPLVSRCLREFESFYLPVGRRVFLSDFSLNHASTQASIYLYQTLSRSRCTFQSVDRDFFPFLWCQALGFLGSKVINPKRKCNGPEDFQRLAELPGNRKGEVGQSTARIVVEVHRRTLSGKSLKGALPERAPNPRSETAWHWLCAAKSLGYMLGNRMYEAMKTDETLVPEIGRLFVEGIPTPMAARQAYGDWTSRLEDMGVHLLAKRERL